MYKYVVSTQTVEHNLSIVFHTVHRKGLKITLLGQKVTALLHKRSNREP